MKLIQRIIPPNTWKLPVTILLGIFVGLSIYLIKISNVSSYLSESPKTCINCHVMESQYSSWFHSSHREKATCNDCHVPHENIAMKYFFKGKDGLRHATIFTLRNEPQVIMIKEAGTKVVQNNCLRCHNFVNQEIDGGIEKYKKHKSTEGRLCWDCHREVPHGRVNSLSATPNAIVPELESPVPDWLEKLINK